MHRLNKILDWIIKVNKSGCPLCSPSQRELFKGDLKFDDDILLMTTLSLKAKKLLFLMSHMPKVKDFVAYYPSKILLNLLKSILSTSHRSTEATSEFDLSNFSKTHKRIFVDNLKSALLMAEGAKSEDYVHRLAITAVLIGENQDLSLQDLKLGDQLEVFENFRKEYQALISMDSYLNDPWKKEKMEDRCFAIHSLFSGTQETSEKKI